MGTKRSLTESDTVVPMPSLALGTKIEDLLEELKKSANEKNIKGVVVGENLLARFSGSTAPRDLSGTETLILWRLNKERLFKGFRSVMLCCHVCEAVAWLIEVVRSGGLDKEDNTSVYVLITPVHDQMVLFARHGASGVLRVDICHKHPKSTLFEGDGIFCP
jgi:hypothetical protein